VKIEKRELKVNIICEDGSLVKGVVHIGPGERLLDFMNDEKEDFIPVTKAEFYNIKEVHSFRLFNEMSKKKPVVILNKLSIKLIEEI
jgi:spore coat polysaccharide biosynthesis predicted glycosyltransferase SpsG